MWSERNVWTICASDVEFAEFEHYPRKGDSPRYFKFKPRKVTAIAMVAPHEMIKETIPMACSVTHFRWMQTTPLQDTNSKVWWKTMTLYALCRGLLTGYIRCSFAGSDSLAGLYLFRKLKLSDIKPPLQDYMAFLGRMRDLQQIYFDRTRTSWRCKCSVACI